MYWVTVWVSPHSVWWSVCKVEQEWNSVSQFWVLHFVSYMPSNRVFLKALLFVKSGYYVNTARVDLALLVVGNSYHHVCDKKSLTICIMTGTLMECFIVDSSEAVPWHVPYPIHKVTIAPLDQDWCRDVSVWDLLFNFCVISGMLTEAGFGFATCGEGKDWKNSMYILSSTASGLSLIFSASIYPHQWKSDHLLWS